MDGVFSLQGLAGSQGYAIGTAVVLHADTIAFPRYLITAERVDFEYQRVLQAIQETKKEIQEHIECFPSDAPNELLALLNVHELMLSDPMLYEGIHTIINTNHYNAEWALSVHGTQLAAQFANLDDSYLQERAQDITQIIQLIQKKLLRLSDDIELEHIDSHHDAIIIAHDIAPAEMLKLRQHQFKGFCTNVGGINSHTAIVARGMGIPAILNLQTATQIIKHGDRIIVDGYSGTLLVNPCKRIEAHYRQAQTHEDHKRADLQLLKNIPCFNAKGERVNLLANIESPQEVQTAITHGAEGIGLFRSEFLFIGRTALPSEEEQYQAYREVLSAMAHQPVTIRTIDIGADKLLNQYDQYESPLGQRGIRYALAHTDLFKTQLRALLKASLHGSLKILIPMVSSAQELITVRALLKEVNQELADEGVHVNLDEIALGAMIEVPAAALMIDLLAPYIDFISIGTNDLIQYTIAIDRDNPSVAELYNPHHPSILRLIKHILEQAKKAQLEASICGEMAGDTSFTELLLEYGLTQFSMSSAQILKVKSQIQEFTLLPLARKST